MLCETSGKFTLLSYFVVKIPFKEFLSFLAMNPVVGGFATSPERESGQLELELVDK